MNCCERFVVGGRETAFWVHIIYECQSLWSVGEQRGLVVKRLPGNQEVGGSYPTTAM